MAIVFFNVGCSDFFYLIGASIRLKIFFGGGATGFSFRSGFSMTLFKSIVYF
jgi:hypothetical protein